MRQRAMLVARMMLEDPHCWFCGVEVVQHYIPDGVLPPNFATFDHKYQRCNPDVAPQNRSSAGGQLACKECNDARGWIGMILTRARIRKVYEFKRKQRFQRRTDIRRAM